MATRKELPATRRYADPGSVSARLFRQAQSVMPGGNSRTSVFIAPHPPYAAEGAGCWLTDADGDRRLDLLNTYTLLIHAHAHPSITEAATRRLARGASFPLPTQEEIELASLLVERLAADADRRGRDRRVSRDLRGRARHGAARGASLLDSEGQTGTGQGPNRTS